MDGFTIPKKKKKTQDAGGDSSAAKAPPPARSNRKVLPTRTSRTADAKLETPEWEAMTKLITSFHARADCCKYYLFLANLLLACFLNLNLTDVLTLPPYIQPYSKSPLIGNHWDFSSIPK